MSSNTDNNNWKNYGKIAAITGGVILGEASIQILINLSHNNPEERKEFADF